MICKRCFLDKSTTEFNKDSRATSGHYYICRGCQHIVRKKYYAEHREKALHDAKLSYHANRLEWRERNKKWHKENKARVNARIAKRNYLKTRATPLWAKDDAIKEIYRLAETLSKETGIEHHVDHIIPLKHDLVCGLHVETNLQVIPAIENLRKKNKFTIDG